MFFVIFDWQRPLLFVHLSTLVLWYLCICIRVHCILVFVYLYYSTLYFGICEYVLQYFCTLVFVYLYYSTFVLWYLCCCVFEAGGEYIHRARVVQIQEERSRPPSNLWGSSRINRQTMRIMSKKTDKQRGSSLINRQTAGIISNKQTNSKDHL